MDLAAKVRELDPGVAIEIPFDHDSSARCAGYDEYEPTRIGVDRPGYRTNKALREKLSDV
jgi:hypothetical protein